MYDLLEYGQSYSMTSGSLWNYYWDEIDDVDDNASDSKSFEYKTKIVVKTPKKNNTTRKWMRHKPITTTSSANFKYWSHCSTQIY